MATESKLSLKLMINTQTNRVLFAEAGKDCIDFLLHILSLPIATVICLLKEHEMVGCLGNLYASVENLNETYIHSNQNKSVLLKPIGAPTACATASSVPLILLEGASAPARKVGYACNGCRETARYPYRRNLARSRAMEHNDQIYFSDDQNALCPTCQQQMTMSMTYVAPPDVEGKASIEGGFVKGVVTYMVMDDLVINPMSTVSSLTLINKFNIKNVSILQERDVYIGMTEALKLLKSSLHSKMVLTEVFLTNK